MTGVLLERDIERAFELVVPDWQIERASTLASAPRTAPAT
jgi:hypothetical protein